MEFEWAEKKAAENARRHDGIRFEEAKNVFFDGWAIEDFDVEHSDDQEERFVIVGLARNKLLRVVYTVRERIRIISAQKAQPFEREANEKNRNEYDR